MVRIVLVKYIGCLGQSDLHSFSTEVCDQPTPDDTGVITQPDQSKTSNCDPIENEDLSSETKAKYPVWIGMYLSLEKDVMYSEKAISSFTITKEN